MLNRLNKQRGFTLVELIVTMTIMGLMASIAYPSYTRFLTDGKATQAEAVIGAILAAEKMKRQITGTFIGNDTAPTDSDGDGWVELSDGNGCYTIDGTVVDVGEAPNFEFQIAGATIDNITIRARGKNGGLRTTDTLQLAYTALLNPRVTWTAGGHFSAPN